MVGHKWKQNIKGLEVPFLTWHLPCSWRNPSLTTIVTMFSERRNAVFQLITHGWNTSLPFFGAFITKSITSKYPDFEQNWEKAHKDVFDSLNWKGVSNCMVPLFTTHVPIRLSRLKWLITRRCPYHKYWCKTIHHLKSSWCNSRNG